jgi:hypothetical protein
MFKPGDIFVIKFPRLVACVPMFFFFFFVFMLDVYSSK